MPNLLAPGFFLMEVSVKFYRVGYSREGGNSGGYAWFTSRAEAVKAAKADQAQEPDEYDYGTHGKIPITQMIDEIEVKPTKTGILRLLNDYASHPDNG